MKKSAKTKADATKELRTNEKKWTKKLMEAGWTAIPSVLVERQKALGLDAVDMNILLHLASYWWTADNKPHPSKKTIAVAMGLSPRTVQRRIAQMENDGLIKREQRRVPGQGSRTNLYHLEGLIKSAAPYADEKLQERERRAADDKERVKKKGKPKLTLVSGKSV